MKFETKTIHGVREGKKKELWGTNVNFASTFPVAEFGVTQEFEYSRVSAPTRNELEEIRGTCKENSALGVGGNMGKTS